MELAWKQYNQYISATPATGHPTEWSITSDLLLRKLGIHDICRLCCLFSHASRSNGTENHKLKRHFCTSNLKPPKDYVLIMSACPYVSELHCCRPTTKKQMVIYFQELGCLAPHCKITMFFSRVYCPLKIFFI
jgi:hypothetical protein